ncbi:hypothetical protein EV359DRAFT_68813 [Lentinula novae-zelandiae]|nr:hypothetical protein EV359DRAFT_68813 [Lentinula novae-zelandiae]
MIEREESESISTVWRVLYTSDGSKKCDLVTCVTVCMTPKVNTVQKEVKELLKATLTAWKAGGSPEQILVLVHGPSGTGKTMVLESIATLFDDMDSAHLLLKASASEGAANKLGGTYINFGDE